MRRWRRWLGVALLWLVGLGGPAGATGLPQQPQIDAARQDLNAGRWEAARQRLQPLLAPGVPALGRAQAHLLLASSALRQGRHADGVPHVREALRLYGQPQGLAPQDLFDATVGALHTATWLDAGAGLWPQAVQTAQAGLQRSLHWPGRGGGPGGVETLEFRQVLLAHAVQQLRWVDAQAQVVALQRWLPADTACTDDLCRRVQGHRLQLHKALGETQAAYALAQAIQRNPAPIPADAAAWNAINLADLARQLDRPTESLAWLDAALALALPAESPALVAAQSARLDLLIDTDVASPAVRASAPTQAAQWADRARHAHGLVSAAHGEAVRLQSALALRQGDFATGSRLAAEALAIAWAADDPRLAWNAGLRLSNNAGHAGQREASIFYAKLAVNAAQAVRAGTLGLPVQRQYSQMQDKREEYVDLADALLDQRRLPEAEQLLAMAREEDYHQLVRSAEPRRQRVAFTGAEQPLAQAVDARRQALTVAAADWTRQLRPLGAPEQPLQKALDATVQALLAARVLSSSPHAADAADAAGHAALPGMPGAPALAQRLSKVPHVYHLPTPERLRIAVVRGGRTEVVDVPVTQAELLRRIADLRSALQNPARDARAPAQALHALLWAPIAHLLPSDAGSRVVLHPEGALRYLPFATLHDGTGWLVERHVLSLNAGGDGDARAAPPVAVARTGWALFGSRRGTAGLPDLPQVADELTAVRRSGPAGTSVAMDAGFTSARLRSALAQRSVVHIASHFVLAPGDSAASWLQLGGGERLSLAALAGDTFRFDGLELLTLSACDTAVPLGVDAQGRSLDSLAWLAHARGARNVLASLWPVPDGATAALMGRFYQGLAAGQDKPEALRAAQLALLAQPAARGQPVRGLKAQSQLAPPEAGMHPYHWGAFVLLAAERSDATE